MFKTGLICRKTAGEEKGRICIVLERQENIVLVDGDVKRKKCNILHLEPVAYTEIKKDAPHEEVLKVLEAAGFKVKPKQKKKERWKKKLKEK